MKHLFKNIKFFGFAFLLVFIIGCQSSGQTNGILVKDFPEVFRDAIEKIHFDSLGEAEKEVNVKKVDAHTVHVNITFTLKDSLKQDDWQLNLQPAFHPTFNWAPHLTPTDEHIIGQHVFRAPALMAADSEQLLVIVPDLDLLNENPPVRWYMDMNAPENVFTLGMSNQEVSGHVLFKRAPGASYPKGKVEFGFYLMCYKNQEALEDPFRKTLAFFWNHWGQDLFERGNPIKGSLTPYIKHTYDWAFNYWGDQVWQQFKLGDKEVGASTFIVNVTQSPNYPGEVNEREFRSVWNQAWFSSLRSASGLYRYARRTGNDSLMKKALLTKELALSFPKKEGFFYGLIGTEMKDVEIDGKEYRRSKGWDTYFWGNSNRNPYTTDPKTSPFHILDMSWTAYLMLKWYQELEKDPRLLDYAEDYAASLMKIQFGNGFFPTWLDLETLEPLNRLKKSPETAMSVTFLLTLYQITGKEDYKKSALKGMRAVMTNDVFTGRWEDFETYWSCSRIGSQNWVGHKVVRNNMFKQNNFSMFWTATALLTCFKMTHDSTYLQTGQRVLDEMLMTQATWHPQFIPIKTLGGFGVLNADGEWNDARQSLFSELIIRYGIVLDKQEYIQRGLAAMRASFVMMYCPENPDTKKQWEQRWPFFGKEDYGFMMENYGHGGETNTKGLGIGEFTIYDWGNGAASEAYNRLIDHYGKAFVDQQNTENYKKKIKPLQAHSGL